jgi:uncharacterized protein
MRRLDRQVLDAPVIADIIRRSQVCRLGLTDGDQSYVVPLCFGFQDRILYFHCAAEGYKLDILRKNNKVCVEFDVDQELIQGDKACGWSMHYSSVIGFGRASIIEAIEEKRMALTVIMDHYAKGPWSFSETELRNVTIVEVRISKLTCKVRR